MEYDLELEKAVKEIKKIKAKTGCIQLPDGLKEKATEIASYLEKRTNSTILIWADTCFGACDIPSLKVDLLIHFGHSKWKS